MPSALGKVITILIFIIYLAGSSCQLNNKKKQEIDVSIKSLEDSIAELNKMGEYYINEKEYKKANEFANKSLSKISNLRVDIQDVHKIIPYNIKANYLLDISYDSSKIYANKALELAIKYKNKKEEAIALNLLGNAYYLTGNNNKALEIWEKSLAIAQKNCLEVEEAKVLCNIGVIHKIWGDYNKAISYYQLAMKTYEELNDSILIAKLLNNIGCIYFSYKIDYKKALDYYVNALKIYTQYKDSITIADICSNIGIVYSEINENKKALEYFTQSYIIYKSIGDRNGIANSYSQLGEIQIILGDFKKALKYFKKAQGLYKDIGEQSNFLYSYVQIAGIYKKMGKFNKALDYHNRYLKYAESQNFKSDILEQYKAISNIYEALGNYNKAIEYYKKYSLYKDSLVKEKYIIQIAELETIYKTEKKENEIIQLEKEKLKHEAEIRRQKLLKILAFTISIMFFLLTSTILLSFLQKRKSNKILASKNYEINEKNMLLKKSIIEKETFLKEVHHRVKNNLQIISSLLSLQTRYINDLRISEEILEGKNRVKSMALIHETLYSYNNLTSVNFKPYIIKLIRYIASTYKISGKVIKSNIDIDDINLDINIAIPLGLIVNELISNIYKYAFTYHKKGEIVVTLNRIDTERILLRIRDNGIGFSKDIDLNNIKTLGLRLVKRLIYQIDAEFTISTKKGTTCNIIFKKQKYVA